MAKKSGNNNVVIWVLLGILVVCVLVLGIGFYKYFYAGSGKTKYGDRLNGIEDHPISESLNADVAGIYSDNENINKVTVTVEGKIIYITIDFKTAMKSTEAQDLAIKSLDAIGEGNLMYYDIQFLLTYSAETSEENTVFPMFGAKNASSNKVVW